MLFGSATQDLKSGRLTYPLLAARRFIHAFTGLRHPTQKEQVLLAAAHYTLAGEQDLSLPRSTLHLNTAITLLKKVQPPFQSPAWQAQLAQAYFRRAEVLEQKQAFAQAFCDYQETLNLLKAVPHLEDEDQLLLARTALCIADLMNYGAIDPSDMLFEHPLAYVNQALGSLDTIQDQRDEIVVTYAYAHQIAGISLSDHDFHEAEQAFTMALSIALKTHCTQTAPLLANIYTHLGILYEHRTRPCPLLIAHSPLSDHALLYFGLSLLFSAEEPVDDDPDDHFALDCLFDMIYSVLDPYPQVLPQRTRIQLVDALIKTYTAVVQQSLPNQALLEQLSQGDALDSFARHIYWLVLEIHAQQNPHKDFIPDLIAPYHPPSISIAFSRRAEAMLSDKPLPNNVYYLKPPIQQ